MYFDEMKIGDEVKLDGAEIKKEPMIAFAKAYDDVPLHTDEEYAKTTRFGGLIAPGMFSFLEIWNKYLEKSFFEKELIAGKSTKVEWLLPVFAGDVLTGTARITALTEKGRHSGTVEFTIDVFNQKNEQVMTAVTEAVVAKTPQKE